MVGFWLLWFVMLVVVMMVMMTAMVIVMITVWASFPSLAREQQRLLFISTQPPLYILWRHSSDRYRRQVRPSAPGMIPYPAGIPHNHIDSHPNSVFDSETDVHW